MITHFASLFKANGLTADKAENFKNYLTLMTSSTRPVSQWYPSLSLKDRSKEQN